MIAQLADDGGTQHACLDANGALLSLTSTQRATAHRTTVTPCRRSETAPLQAPSFRLTGSEEQVQAQFLRGDVPPMPGLNVFVGSSCLKCSTIDSGRW